jgi:hypothetical protein
MNRVVFQENLPMAVQVADTQSQKTPFAKIDSETSVVLSYHEVRDFVTDAPLREALLNRTATD